MLSQKRDGKTEYLGLAPEVLYRIEVGLAIVDDGDRLYKLEQQLFERFLDPSCLLDVERDPGLSRVAEALQAIPTVFRLYPSQAQAIDSLNGKEI